MFFSIRKHRTHLIFQHPNGYINNGTNNRLNQLKCMVVYITFAWLDNRSTDVLH